MWERSFARFPNGSERSYIDTFSAAESNGRLRINLRIFTSRPYSDEERAGFVREMAALLHRAPNSVELSLVEIPTSRYEIATRTKPEAPPPAPPPPSFAAMVSSLNASVDAAVSQVRLPPPALLLQHTFTSGASGAVVIEIAYLSDRAIGDDARALLEGELQRLTNDPSLTLTLRYIPSVYTVSFKDGSAALPAGANDAVRSVRDLATAHPEWRIELAISAKDRKRRDRIATITKALSGGGIAAERIDATESNATPVDGKVTMTLVPNPPAATPGP